MNLNDKIYVAGHNGMLGSAIVRRLKKNGYNNIITSSSSNLDLRVKSYVEDFFKEQKPDVVILAAAKVGNIQENKDFPVEFLSDNIQIELNVINTSFKYNVKNLIFVSSACVYPEDSKPPYKEEYILNGHLECENEAYALSKILGIKLCEYYNREYGLNYISVIPPNFYGENSTFDSKHSHIIPAVITRMYNAKLEGKKSVSIWGSGEVYREFIYIDDAADAIIFLLNSDTEESVLNIGTGELISIKSLVYEIKNIVGFKGDLVFDKSKPEGVYCRYLDNSKISLLGWKPKVGFKEGLKRTFDHYKTISN